MNQRLLTNFAFLFFVLPVAIGSSACTSSNDVSSQVNAGKIPELNDEKIRETINDARVRNIPEKDTNSKPTSWSFEPNEPKEFKSIEKQIDGEKATVVIDITTRSAPGARNPQELSGKIRLHYELHRGFVLRQWQIVKTENISMTYRNLAPPPPSTPLNGNQVGNG